MFPETTLFFNPDCSKCREALCMLDDARMEVKVVEYLTDVPSREDLQKLSRALGLPPGGFIRKGEEEYQLYAEGKNLADDELFDLMLRYPKLIERPIFVRGDKAVIGRPPSRISELL